MPRRPPSDIDPKRLDVANSPRRRRRRVVPDPSPSVVALKPKALSRALQRPVPPGVMLQPGEGDSYLVSSPHSDADGWELHLADAFGTRSQSVLETFVFQLRDLVTEAWDDDANRWRPSEKELNAALAMVNGLKPRNEAEAAMAAQMVSVHWLQIRLSAQAMQYGQVDARSAAIAGKLARTYVQQMEAFNRLRGRGSKSKQSIVVRKELHQHVHYHRGEGETGRQPHATGAGEPVECTALPSPDAGGQVVPLRRGKR